MEESKCLECGLVIEENNKSLAVGNQHVDEFDGSLEPALDLNGVDNHVMNEDVYL